MSEWIIHLIDQTGYLGVGFLMFLETVFPPIPSEVIMPVAGLAAARGKMDIFGVVASGTLGAMLGNYFWYLVARVIGRSSSTVCGTIGGMPDHVHLLVRRELRKVEREHANDIRRFNLGNLTEKICQH